MPLLDYLFHVCLFISRISTVCIRIIRSVDERQKINVFMSTFMPVYFYHGLVPCIPF